MRETGATKLKMTVLLERDPQGVVAGPCRRACAARRETIRSSSVYYRYDVIA